MKRIFNLHDDNNHEDTLGFLEDIVWRTIYHQLTPKQVAEKFEIMEPFMNNAFEVRSHIESIEI